MRNVSIALGSMMVAMACRLAPADPLATQPDSMEAVRYFSCSENMSDGHYLEQLQERLCRKLEPDAKATAGLEPIELRNIVYIDNDANLGHPEILSLHFDATRTGPFIPAKLVDLAVAALPGVVDSLDRELIAKNNDSVMQANRTLEQRYDLNRSELTSLRAQMSELQARLSKLGIYDADPDDYHQLMHKLDEQRQMAQIDRAATAARRDALAATIDQLSAKALDKADTDPIAAELQKVVAAKEEGLKHTQDASAKGLVAQNDLTNAQADLAESKVRLLERKEAVSRAAGGDALVQLQNELQLIQVNIAEAQAKDKAMDDLAHASLETQDIINQLKERQHHHDMLEAKGQELFDELDKKENSVNDSRPQTHHVSAISTSPSPH